MPDTINPIYINLDYRGVDNFGGSGVFELTVSSDNLIAQDAIDGEINFDFTFGELEFIVSSIVDFTTNSDVTFYFDWSDADLIIEEIKKNWLSWSKFGQLDWTIDRSNEAGETPMGWSGEIFAIIPYYDRLICYGSGGVSEAQFKEEWVSLTTIKTTGLKGRKAVCGGHYSHFMIDVDGNLIEVSNKANLTVRVNLTKLGYKYFLSKLSENVIMSYSDLRGEIYICDEKLGFMYDITTGVLVEYYKGITDCGNYQGETILVGQKPARITPMVVQLPRYNFGVKGTKLLREVSCSFSGSEQLYVQTVSNLGTKVSSMNPDRLATVHLAGEWFDITVFSKVPITGPLTNISLSGNVLNYNPTG